MVDTNNVTLVLSLADGEEAKRLVLAGLRKAIGEHDLRSKPTKDPLEWPPLGLQALTPREAHFATSEWCPLEDSVGRIAVDSIAVYPPGIPLIWPGQRIERTFIEYIQCVKERAALVTGLHEKCIKVVK